MMTSENCYRDSGKRVTNPSGGHISVCPRPSVNRRYPGIGKTALAKVLAKSHSDGADSLLFEKITVNRKVLFIAPPKKFLSNTLIALI